VQAALQRLLPGAEVLRQPGRSRDVADFVVRYQGDQLFVETKWRADTTLPFGGFTLSRLTQNLPPEAKLLVVVNTDKWQPGVTKTFEEAFGKRGRIVTWRDVRDDAALGEAITSLLRADA
jgi:hypothetical protein